LARGRTRFSAFDGSGAVTAHTSCAQAAIL
jgi:hypothetical protein